MSKNLGILIQVYGYSVGTVSNSSSTYEWRQKKRKIWSKNTPEKQNNVYNHLQWGQGVKSIDPVPQNLKRYIEFFIFEGISHLHNVYGEILV